MKWFTLSWWQYLATSRTCRNLWCRIKGHPNGVWWHTCTRLEPDMRCIDCGEDLG